MKDARLCYSLAHYQIPVAVIVALALTKASAKILRDYERAVVFTSGRFEMVKDPGLVMLSPYFREIMRVDLRNQVIDRPAKSWGAIGDARIPHVENAPLSAPGATT